MNISELANKFSKADISDFPEFHDFKKPLERGLWILWVAKEKLGIKKLSAEQIASIIRDVKEISIDARPITNSFNRAKDKIHTYKDNGEAYFEIMKPGKDYLISLAKIGYIEIFYFEPEKPYSSKRILSKQILGNLKGELRLVDPYCSERTLDILKEVKNCKIKFLTRTENLKDKKPKFLRDLQDFKSENTYTEFRDYPHKDIHDRYIGSAEKFIISQ